MARESYSISEAARLLGVSIDTIRRWERVGKLTADRDFSNRRVIPAAEIERLRGDASPPRLSARNRLSGIVTDVTVEGLLAQVEIVVDEPVHLVAVVTRDAARALELRTGTLATAVVKSTSMMIER